MILIDAQLKKIQVTPAKFNEDGEVEKEETATLTLEVPLDGLSQKEAILDLFNLLSREWVKVVVEPKQILMDVEDRKIKSA